MLFFKIVLKHSKLVHLIFKHRQHRGKNIGMNTHVFDDTI